MKIKVNMKSFADKWEWNQDTVYVGDQIAKTGDGVFWTFCGDTYIRMLTDFGVEFSANAY